MSRHIVPAQMRKTDNPNPPWNEKAPAHPATMAGCACCVHVRPELVAKKPER